MIVINRPTHTVTPDNVKQALECLDESAALGLSVLMQLPLITSPDSAGELRDLMLDVIAEMADARTPRDAQSGRLVDYYVNKAGSHEVIMERLRLTRTTYYRRLRRGYRLIAQELDRLSKFVIRFQC